MRDLLPAIFLLAALTIGLSILVQPVVTISTILFIVGLYLVMFVSVPIPNETHELEESEVKRIVEQSTRLKRLYGKYRK